MSDYIVVLFAKRLRHPPPYVTHLLPTYPPNRLLGQVTVANNHLRHHARVSCYCIYIYVYLILCFRQGLSSVLDAASRGVATKPKSANKQPLPPSDNSNDDVDGRTSTARSLLLTILRRRGRLKTVLPRMIKRKARTVTPTPSNESRPWPFLLCPGRSKFSALPLEGSEKRFFRRARWLKGWRGAPAR